MPSSTASAGSARRSGTKGVARADREEQIVEVAGQVFAERGFALASVSEIAERAGISKPLIYNYFGSKEGLLVACLRRGGQVLAEEMERTAALGEVGIARALVTLDGVFRVLEPQPWIWRLLNDPTLARTSEVAAIIDVYQDRVAALARDGVGELMHLAGDDDPVDIDAMTHVWSNVFDSLVTWWVDHPDETPASMTARSSRLFAAVFGADRVGLRGR
ncbi:TetR/AcrR family transcriptional regulator [Nocardioides silvaticus]|uniref:TetR/AcrR family transcriptional regulator n=1 Tax=Nocardioides silvaticus TaxID=2201891 RepID=A0A316TE24_9ACTN|nr:TetR/AcrR family transcriptional regulator [Nocardioides silvaticus]PWN01495.1 TetR/AcrR family transcriptional regulator [Nocardioides silvaticus]